MAFPIQMRWNFTRLVSDRRVGVTTYSLLYLCYCLLWLVMARKVNTISVFVNVSMVI